MMSTVPDHFSHHLELNLNKIPARMSDRTSWRFQLPGIIFGALLFFIGLYELLNGFRNLESNSAALQALASNTNYQPFLNPAFFDIVFMCVGLGMILASITSYIRYKKIIFDGKNIFVAYRPVFGKKVSFKENLKSYQGVRFRIEFFQFGFLNKNKYILELYHKDPSKIVPLYISTSSKNIRKLWEHYAKELSMPVLLNTENGLVVRDVKNFGKSVKELADLGYIIDDYDSYEPLPSSVKYARRQDKIVLKAKKAVWDVYNFIAWIAIFMAGSVLALALFNYETVRQSLSSETFFAIFGLTSVVIVVAVFILFRKEKIIFKRDKIVNVHKYMLFSTKHDELMKTVIEAIEITENPATGRYFVAIIGQERMITFGTKLPIEDLRWIKKFLIHEIIK